MFDLGIKEQKSRETREQLKSCETKEIPYTCRYTMSTNIWGPPLFHNFLAVFLLFLFFNP